MRTRSLVVALFATMSIVLTACGTAATPAPSAAAGLKVGMVTDVGTLDDKSFNEASWKGTQDGAAAIGTTATNIVTKTPADYAPNIQSFVDQKYNIIVTVGFALGDATLKAAIANPTIKFIGVDQFICVPKDANDKTCAGADPGQLPGTGLHRGPGRLPRRDRRGDAQQVGCHRRHRWHQYGPAGRVLHQGLRERREVRQSEHQGPRAVRLDRHHEGVQRPDHGQGDRPADDRPEG